ncbi:uncharacterized protein LOC144591798, partial [Rhinoraja longicauda]
EETLRKRRVSDEALTLSVAEGALAVEKFDHPFLLNTVFTEVPDGITRVSVTLDVETAHRQLQVSDDRKSMQFVGGRRSRGLCKIRASWDRKDSHLGDITGRWGSGQIRAVVWESRQSL